MNIKQFNNVNVGGIETACIDRQQITDLIMNIATQYRADDSNKGTPYLIFDNNGHAISFANTNSEFKQQLAMADLVHADGQSIVSFSKRLKGHAIPERSATTDMIHDIAEMQNRPLRHFLLGGKDDVVTQAAELLDNKHPNFTVAGLHHGYFSENEEKRICDLINQTKPDVLWVGLGKPKEQAFCIRNKSRLDVPVVITCGGCYNYITGDYPRAPIWMQNAGIEWVHRVATNPRQLFMRYLLTNPHAIYCVFAKKQS
ncbi:WecB/TagA/CpsF family glycosyltransferase [Vibrio hippocampi]|uniref:N-acetylglucosaminyldiphosphoundecaprenol N-acetyl-beta-D-mannosaminyltransferase n=1 Tax=Vibrio hippocampi TaxID=654686 RepID=A0ABM8ZL84_9VIBR|nr:WecB/TagA/CpsF family glycosyltransferase [Vibrio hippocampi]CAH0529052.1 N-acetylglucosaminyldiphosphoundecaprenol N-acetyl-beta-D-mannosaminyltransferase [Vibrio hippocampi]